MMLFMDRKNDLRISVDMFITICVYRTLNGRIKYKILPIVNSKRLRERMLVKLYNHNRCEMYYFKILYTLTERIETRFHSNTVSRCWVRLD